MDPGLGDGNGIVVSDGKEAIKDEVGMEILTCSIPSRLVRILSSRRRSTRDSLTCSVLENRR